MRKIMPPTNYLFSMFFIVIGFVNSNVMADNVYDAETNRLYTPFVQVGNETYFDVVITVDQLISVGGLSEGTTQTYNLRSMYEALVKNSDSYQFSLKGAVSGVNVTGNGSQTDGKLTTSSFQGLPALVKISNVTLSINVDGQIVPSAGLGQAYYDTNYNYLG